MPRPLVVNQLPGCTPYPEGYTLQKELVEKRSASQIDDTLLLVEHDPVITLGRNAATSGVVASSVALSNIGIAVHRIERGGQATYHGPGQIVGYPIVDLHGLKMGARRYVEGLEETMIRAAASLGVTAERKEGLTGVFTDYGKIGAVGVRITRGITYHGFAFNVAPDLTHYRLIVPCGLTDTPVASIERILGTQIKMDTARTAIVTAFKSVFDYK